MPIDLSEYVQSPVDSDVLVHPDGLFYSKSRQEHLKPMKTGRGWLVDVQSDEGKRVNRACHIVVAMTFLGEKPVRARAVFKDGDSNNFKLSNLDWSIPASREPRPEDPDVLTLEYIGEMYKTWRDYLLKQTARYGLSPEDAEDVVQDAFTLLITFKHTYNKHVVAPATCLRRFWVASMRTNENVKTKRSNIDLQLPRWDTDLSETEKYEALCEDVGFYAPSAEEVFMLEAETLDIQEAVGIPESVMFEMLNHGHTVDDIAQMFNMPRAKALVKLKSIGVRDE